MDYLKRRFKVETREYLVNGRVRIKRSYNMTLSELREYVNRKLKEDMSFENIPRK